MTSPHVITPQPGRRGAEHLVALLEERRAELAARLLDAPLLLRGFDVAGEAQFAHAMQALSARPLRKYEGGASPRRALAAPAPVYNSTDYPPHLELPLHNELSYAANFPQRIAFCCLTAPARGGATTLGDSRRILAAIPNEARGRFERLGVQYVRLLGPEKGSGFSWQDAFGSDDRAVVAERCGAAGAQYEWLAGDMLRVVQSRPALSTHPVTGDELWFNQVAGFHPRALDAASRAELTALRGEESRFRLNVYYGDGSPIGAAVIDMIGDILKREATPHEWQAGDLLLLDNLLFAHGRKPFTGPRRIAVAMQ